MSRATQTSRVTCKLISQCLTTTNLLSKERRIAELKTKKGIWKNIRILLFEKAVLVVLSPVLFAGIVISLFIPLVNSDFLAQFISKQDFRRILGTFCFIFYLLGSISVYRITPRLEMSSDERWFRAVGCYLSTPEINGDINEAEYQL